MSEKEDGSEIEAIDVAIREFIEATEDPGDVLAGFVVFYALMNEGGATSCGYTTSAGLSSHAATGIAMLGSKALSDDLEG